jgi:hypothetical protein
MKKKTKRRLKKILALGILGAGAKMGMDKMAANRAIKKTGMGAKKGKMIKARGGRLARVKPTKLM